MKVHELAKELGVESKKIIEFLTGEGVDVKTHMSTVTDKMAEKTRNHFKPEAEKPKGAVKAVALPDYIIKKMNAEAKAGEEKKAPEEKKASEEAKPKDAEALKKKKKIAVFNPQNATSEKGKELARQQRPERPAREQVKRPLPSQMRPARDRRPDDYVEPVKKEVTEPVKAAENTKLSETAPAKAPEQVKKPLPSQIRPARDRVPDDYVAPENRKPENKESEKAEQKPKTLPSKPADKPKESEAIKSLREKIVKGTINPDDLMGSNRSSKDNKKNDRPGGRNDGRPDNRNRKPGDRPFNNNNNNNNNNRPGGPAAGGQRPGADKSKGGPVMDDSKGKTKGGKQAKGKFEKKGGDKFDRLENEKAAKRAGKMPVKEEPVEEEIKVITLPEAISLKDFAAKLKMQPAALIKKLFLQGQVLTVNDMLDFDTAEAIALDMDIIAEKEVKVDYIAELLKEEDEDEATMVKRPPVVCVMGHVDHGKTSLLDAIRKTSVVSREAGGITQHIGAYTVEINGESITFLDTPGHEAFTAMRLRGAQATDVAILVVAADDGVMPQTIEAINHAKAANIHVIVAVNKIDKPGANIDKVKQELSDQGLVPEDWGGDTIFVPVSAKQGTGIENLLEMVILDTEILELKANPDRMARGIVIEAKLDKGRGSVATLLVQKGTLKVGDHIAMGEAYGKVRAMTNDKGQKIKEAPPSTPVEITGMNGVPNAGETFVAFNNDKDAKQFAQVFIEENRKKLLEGTKTKMSLDDVFNQMKAGELKELDIIIKADVQGSVEAIKESLEKLSNDEVVVRCIHSGVGNVSESDAILASASNAIIIAFNVGVNPDAKATVEREKVDLRNYNVIYNAIDDVELAMKGMLEPIYEEVILGHVEVRQTFKASGVGIIAGSYVTDGLVKRNAKVRLSRAEEQLFDGPIGSLKRFNDDVKEVKSGFECGIVLKDFQDIREGDIMEVYEMKEVARV
ncbi:MAG: translation initiation factor IF-2 [Parasporobacterium sp.]|nr:translation initiation factor IF-2 [Parasporobacterium sp.]